MKKLLAAMVVLLVLVLAVLVPWLADRPEDERPQITEDMGSIAFNPKLGPQTPQEVRQYLESRAAKSRRGRGSAADRRPQALADAQDTLLRRWGFTPEMTQDEMDVVRKQREAVWAFVQHSRTPRYKIRSLLGMNK